MRRLCPDWWQQGRLWRNKKESEDEKVGDKIMRK